MNKGDVSDDAMAGELKLAWAAGFFDGDGCTSITKQQMPGRKNATYRLRLQISQNCSDTLEVFRGAVGEQCFVTTPGETLAHNKQIYSLVYEGRHALAALRKLEPFLVRKRMGAHAAMRFWKEGVMGVLPGPRGFEPDVWRRREYWFRKLRRLDKR